MRAEFFGLGRLEDVNQRISDFVCDQIWGRTGLIDRHMSLGVFDGQMLVAGVLYHNWYPDTGVVELTGASISKRWLSRAVLKAVFAVPFDHLGCQLVVFRVSEHNKPMLRIAKAYGFSEHIIPRLRGRTESEHILTLADDDWRQSRFHKEH